MRLIDADVVKKPIYAEVDNIKGMDMTFDEMDGYNNGIDEMFREVENTPTIDAVKVVRCKGCIFYEKTLSVQGFCHAHGSIVHANAFCSYGSYGEHKEDGEA